MTGVDDQSDQYQAVEKYLRALHEPAFGRPSAIREADVSPDGLRAVVTADVLDDLVGVPRSAIYTAEDGRLRPVSAPGGSACWPRFSPDGRALAFLSDRAEAGLFQLQLLPDGHFGEALTTPKVPGTVEWAHWSPDSRRILLGVAGVGAEMASGQGSGRNDYAAAERPAWYPETDAGMPPEHAWRGLWVYTVDTHEVRRVSPDGLNCWEAGWSGPDAIVAITSTAPTEDDWYDAVLTRIELSGAATTLLTTEVQFGLPVGSPDGRYVAVAQALCSDRWLVAGDVLLHDISSGATRRLDTAGTDVTRLAWVGENRLGYLGLRHLDAVAGIIDIVAGTVTELLVTSSHCGGNSFYPDGAFTADGRVLTIRDDYERPQEVLLGDEVLASIAHPGTDFLRSIAGVAEVVTWPAADGLEIEGILCRPEGDGPFPLIVHVHGGPIWAFRNQWAMRSSLVPLLVSRGYAVLHPNPRGSTGRGQDFAEQVFGDMGGADAADILAGVDAMVARNVADPARIGLVGGSYGGFMAAWLVTQDTRFAASVPLSPVTDWYSQTYTSNIAGWGTRFLDGDPERPDNQAHHRSPVLHASKVRTPCLTMVGGRDRCTPPGQGREFHQALVAQGVPSELVVYPQEGHGVRSYPAVIDFLSRIADWFERFMPA